MSYRSQLVTFDRNPAKLDIAVIDAKGVLFATQVAKSGETEKIVKVPEHGGFTVVALIAGKGVAVVESNGIYQPSLRLESPKTPEPEAPEPEAPKVEPKPEASKPAPAPEAPKPSPAPEPAKAETQTTA